MSDKKVTINAVHRRDMEEFLKSAGLGDEVKKNEFICAGCDKTIKIDDIVFIKTKKPKCLVYEAACYRAVRD